MYDILITGLGFGIRYTEEDQALLGKIANVTIIQELSREELLERAETADIIMTDWTVIDDEVFERAKKLKLVVEHGVGYDNIDVAAATRHGVLVCHTPEVYTTQVAEMAVATLFATSKCICEASANVKNNADWNSAPFASRHVTGKTLGVIGCGRIGSAFIKMLQGFHLRVLVNDPYIPVERIPALGAEPVSLDELLEQSDIISVHTPKNAETIHLLSTPEFAKMKKGVILLNTARGGIVDEQALADALEDGTVRAAALDVLEGEPNIAECPVRKHPKVILTPHLAWKSEFSVAAVIGQCIKNVFAFAEGKPIFVINTELLEENNG